MPNQGLAESALESHVRRARLAADTRDGAGVVEHLGAAWVLSPSAEVANAAVDAFLRLGRPSEGIDWITQNVVRSSPGQVWAVHALADAAAGQLEPDDTEGQRLVQATKATRDEWEALNQARSLLRKVGAWHALQWLLEVMCDRTLSIRDQLALHEELIEVVANKLSSPAEAKPIRQRMEKFKDIPVLVATYWKSLIDHPDDPDVVDEAAAFFTLNRMWTDLEALASQQLEVSRPAEAGRWVVDLETACTNAEPPRWQELHDALTKLADRHPELPERLDAVARASAALAAGAGRPQPGAEDAPPEPLFPVWVLGVMAATIGVGASAILIWAFLA